MARNSGDVIENDFSRALVTEATNLNFPENACTDADNCRFYRTGKVYRRGGIVPSAAGSFRTSNSGEFHEMYFWRNPGNRGDVTLLVIQDGTNLEIWDLDEEGEPVELIHTVNLLTYRANSNIGECTFATVRGFLVVANKGLDNFYLSYSDDGTVEEVEYKIRIRDIDGLEDGFEVTHRPSFDEINPEHIYNVLNQGWYVNDPIVDITYRGDDDQNKPLDFWLNQIGAWPSYPSRS
jgi:hypothetical protein